MAATSLFEAGQAVQTTHGIVGTEAALAEYHFDTGLLNDNANVTFGQNAARDLSRILNDGTHNAVFGHDAARSLVNGSFNTVVGGLAGARIVGASCNSLLGYRAGASLEGGNNNTFMGCHAGARATTGFNNVCVGVHAGAHLTRGANNVCVGNDLGAAEAEAEAPEAPPVARTTVVGNAARAWGADNVVVGFAGAAGRGAQGNVVLGSGASVADGTRDAVVLGRGVRNAGRGSVLILPAATANAEDEYLDIAGAIRGAYRRHLDVTTDLSVRDVLHVTGDGLAVDGPARLEGPLSVMGGELGAAPDGGGPLSLSSRVHDVVEVAAPVAVRLRPQVVVEGALEAASLRAAGDVVLGGGTSVTGALAAQDAAASALGEGLGRLGTELEGLGAQLAAQAARLDELEEAVTGCPPDPQQPPCGLSATLPEPFHFAINPHGELELRRGEALVTTLGYPVDVGAPPLEPPAPVPPHFLRALPCDVIDNVQVSYRFAINADRELELFRIVDGDITLISTFR